MTCYGEYYGNFNLVCTVIGCTDGDLRLAGGNTTLEGRVEFCYLGEWIRVLVCPDEWDDVDASVVCGQLGFSNIG